MDSLPSQYRAVVFGSRGGIGSALCAQLGADPRCGRLLALHRQSTPAVDLDDETGLARAAEQVRAELGEVELLVDATGALTIDGHAPEKSLRRLDPAVMARALAINAIGPALLLKHFAPLLPRGRRGIFATLSARVGSIADNRRGGWISYRTSKAALNQIVRTAALEIGMRHRRAVVVGLQPGTVATPLTAPFVAPTNALDPGESARRLLHVLDTLEPGTSGCLVDHRGSIIAP